MSVYRSGVWFQYTGLVSGVSVQVWCLVSVYRSGVSIQALQWLPIQGPGVIGSVLELVGPVSMHCDWVRWKV